MPAPPAAAEAVTPRTHLGRGIWWGRTASVLMVALGLTQLLLQLLDHGEATTAVIAALQAALGLGLVWTWWLRTPLTRVGPDGITVREGHGPLRHHPWTDIAHVEPDRPGSPTAVLHLRRGRRVPLPGVHGEAAQDLAAVVAGRTTGAAPAHPRRGTAPGQSAEQR